MFCKSDHVSPSSDDAENNYSYISTATYAFMAGIGTRVLSFAVGRHYDRKLAY
jgi:hypothetical protein